MISVIGEAIVDLVGDAQGRTFAAHAGGSPANVAVGLARLGAPASFFGRIGAGRFGQLLRDHLTDNGVDDRDLVCASEPTCLAVASPGEGGETRYDFWAAGAADWQWRPDELPDPLAEDVDALHAGSIASWRQPGADAIEALMRRERARGQVTLSFDPNCRPNLIGSRAEHRQLVERQVATAHLVKASEQDLRWLYPDEPLDGVVGRWLALGPTLVVVTRGARGAHARGRTMTVDVPAARVARVVDTVGAGDAFTAALLDGLRRLGALRPAARLQELSAAAVDEVLSRASLAGALSTARAGATPPTLAELDEAVRTSQW